MTIVEDAYEEFVSEFGREFTHYPHQGYDGPDDFWNTDQGVSADGTTFTGVTILTESSEDLTGPGFTEEADFRIRTRYSDIKNGDIVEHPDGRRWTVINVVKREVQGRSFAWRIEMTSSEQ